MSDTTLLLEELNTIYPRYRMNGDSTANGLITIHQLSHMRRLINSAICYVDTHSVPAYTLSLTGNDLAGIGVDVSLLVNSPLTELSLLSTAFEYAINHFGPNRLGSRLRLRITTIVADTTIDIARKHLNRLVSVVGVVFSAAAIELHSGSLHLRVCIEDTPQHALLLSTVVCDLDDELIHAAPLGATVRIVGIVHSSHIEAVSVAVIDRRQIIDVANDSELVQRIMEYTANERAQCGGVLPMIVASMLFHIKQLRDDYEMQKAAILLAALTQDAHCRVHTLILCQNSVINQSALTQYLCRIIPRCQLTHVDEPKIAVEVSGDRVGERMIVYHRLALSNDGVLLVDGINVHNGHLDAICECIQYGSIHERDLPPIHIKPTVIAAFTLPNNYDRSYSVIDCIKAIPSSLLKHFSLKVVLAERGDCMSDAMASRVVLDENARMGRGTQEVATLNENDSQRLKRETIMKSSTSFSIHHHMQMYDGHKLNEKSIATFLHFALIRCHPVLSDAAQQLLRDAYQRLHMEYASVNVHVDADLLRMMRSMTLARARIELSSVANASHAQDVDDIISTLYRHISHRVQVGAVENSKPLSKTKRIKLMIIALNKQSSLQKNRIFSVREINDIALALIDRTMSDVELTDMIRELREKYSVLVQRDGGYIISPKPE